MLVQSPIQLLSLPMSLPSYKEYEVTQAVYIVSYDIWIMIHVHVQQIGRIIELQSTIWHHRNVECWIFFGLFFGWIGSRNGHK